MEEKQTVLVVDDNEAVLELMADLLEAFGFKVHKAKEGVEAMELMLTYGHLDHILCDIGLPEGLDGLQFARAVQTVMPHINVVLITGLAKDYVESLPAYDPTFKILRKPISIDALLTVFPNSNAISNPASVTL